VLLSLNADYVGPTSIDPFWFHQSAAACNSTHSTL